jgi:O-antigen/teichoic acid export membrane protein
MNLALLANPLIFTIGNLLIPRAAQARAKGGLQAAQHVVLKVLFCFVSMMAVFAIGLSITGHAIVQLIYGESFAGTEHLAGLLGLTAVMWAISGTCASGLVAVGRPRWGFVASCTGAMITALSITLLAPVWSVYGATLGNLVGNTTAAVIHTWAFISVSGGIRLRSASLQQSAPTIVS